MSSNENETENEKRRIPSIESQILDEITHPEIKEFYQDCQDCQECPSDCKNCPEKCDICQNSETESSSSSEDELSVLSPISSSDEEEETDTDEVSEKLPRLTDSTDFSAILDNYNSQCLNLLDYERKGSVNVEVNIGTISVKMSMCVKGHAS